LSIKFNILHEVTFYFDDIKASFIAISLSIDKISEIEILTLLNLPVDEMAINFILLHFVATNFLGVC